ncbi:MAG: type II secretion system protein [Candidatus Omnitrophica bacterium]|nr:type II secretion system protein [Candidatus Omnitrophota bacterium]
MKAMKMKHGFSLAELLVVVAIFSILASAVALALVSSQRTWATGSGQAVLTAQLRRALDRMSRELTESKTSEIQRPAPNGLFDAAVTFRVPQDQNGDGNVLDANGNIGEWSGWITYRAARVGSGTACVREVAGASEVLASNVSSVLFRRQAATPDVVEVQVSCYVVTEKGQQMLRSMNTRVKLRN